MRKTILLLFLCIKVIAQTGIGTTTPHASAKLDVSATNKGFLPPRIILTSATDATTIASPAEGLLVYNLGSVGLQAGYYYWNGANWATIATGTNAGNAVVSSDLVKLYSEGYSNASGKISHANGYSFTVPVSGRYLFDFSSSGYLNNAVMSITFKVRQGTTDLGTDVYSNANNNVHVVFTGMIEVNLQAGTTYNVFVSSTGSRDSGDYDRVFYKMIAGNLPVNQHMADRNIQLNNNYLSNDGGNEGIRIDNSGNVGIGNNTPTSTLDVTGSLAVSGLTTLKDNVKIGTGIGDEGGEFQFAIPAANTTLQNRVNVDVWQNRIRFFEGSNNAKGVHVDLSKAPDGASGELIWKTSRFVNAETFVTLDNIKVTATRLGAGGNYAGLGIGAVSTTFVANVSANYSNTTVGGNTATNVTYTTTASNSAFGWGFLEGQTSTYIINDITNSRVYRVILMIGASYNNNFISIERLY
ncbi:hypothetical protein ACMH5Q_06450 [Aquirufa lenticrescens]